jgi:hypothetical protein
MPGHVVDFGHDKKEKAAGKATLVCIDYIITMCYNLFD